MVVLLKDFKYLRNTFISWCYLLPPSPSDFSKMDLWRQFHLNYPASYQRQSTRPIRRSLRCIRKFSLSRVFDFGLWCLPTESSWSPSITAGYMMFCSSTWNKLYQRYFQQLVETATDTLISSQWKWHLITHWSGVSPVPLCTVLKEN